MDNFFVNGKNDEIAHEFFDTDKCAEIWNFRAEYAILFI